MRRRRKELLVKYLEFYKKAYEEYGVVVIPSVFSKDETLAIKGMAYECLSRLTANDSPKLQKVRNNGKEFPGLLFWPSSMSPHLSSVAKDERLSSIVQYFLGPNVRWLNNQIYYRESGDGDEFAWHQDITFRTPANKFSGIETKYLQTIIVVDEITEDNGAVEFIYGSHKWGDLNLIPRNGTEIGLRKFNRGNFIGTKVTAKPGDVMLWSVMTVHGSEQNNSGKNRMTYMNGFASDEAILDKSMFPLYLKDGVVCAT